LIVPPNDSAAFLDAARSLAKDSGLRDRFAINARRCAEDKFDIIKIADRFLAVFAVAQLQSRATGSKSVSSASGD
jgi:hypothetical protein